MARRGFRHGKHRDSAVTNRATEASPHGNADRQTTPQSGHILGIRSAVQPGGHVCAGARGAAAHPRAGGGYPMVDITVQLIDGSYHEVDSSEIAFKNAAARAFKTGALNANPLLLEPIMNVIIIT